MLDQKAEPESKKIKLPTNSNYSLFSAPKDLIVLLDKKNNDLFIIKSSAFSSKNIEDDIVLQAQAKDIFWSQNFSWLIYYTDFEMWAYNINNNSNEFINRYGNQAGK